jgi:lysophospholipase L1-like esterase
VLVLVAVVSLGLALLAPQRSARLSAAVAAGGRWLGRTMILAVAAVCGVAVIIPLWALNALVRIDPLDDGWQPAASNWRTRPDGLRPDGQIIGASRIGSVEHLSGPTKRWGRVRRVAVVIVVLAALAAVVQALPDGGNETATEPSTGAAPASAADEDLVFVGLPVTSYAHEDEPWIYDHIREVYEQVHAWDPFLGTRMRDFDGDYLAVKDQARVSYQPADPDLTVWYFGGSTMFGIGQRDNHTIPSEIARLAEKDGISIRSENYGAPGWVNWQETVLLEELLRTEEAPDLIVFYDGANDWSAGQDRLVHGDTDPAHNWRITLSDDEAAMRDRSFPTGNEDVSASDVVPLVAAQYRRGVERARDLADEAGVPVVHFWQPSMETKRYSPSDEGVFERTNIDPPPVGARWSPERHEALVQSKTGAIDVSDALDGIHVPVLWDWAHTNELGARTVAEALYARLAPTLGEATGPR